MQVQNANVPVENVSGYLNSIQFAVTLGDVSDARMWDAVADSYTANEHVNSAITSTSNKL